MLAIKLKEWFIMYYCMKVCSLTLKFNWSLYHAVPNGKLLSEKGNYSADAVVCRSFHI